MKKDLTDEPIKISRKEFDQLVKTRQFILGPWIEEHFTEYGTPYIPQRLWGQLQDGRNVLAGED